jgi:site-specific recombinase XerC
VHHLAAYKQHLEAQNDSPKHIRQTEKRISLMISGCGFERLRDVNLSAIENWLAKQRGAKVFGIKTSNYYARDFKSFCSWLVQVGRAESNPLAEFSPLNAETDLRRLRRALEPADFANLIETTIAAGPYRRISGPDRAILYLVAANTGLRVSELASLTPQSFDLDTGTVVVRAAHSKRRRLDIQPLRADLIELLREWLNGRSGVLWPGNWSEDAAAMLRPDFVDRRFKTSQPSALHNRPAVIG